MVNLSINNKVVEVPIGYTILQACEVAGIQIPRFCYHEKLSIAGNCRMCLVHVDKSVKPLASCAVIVSDGMSVYTDSSIVKKAREGVMEFLLSNHPLDCPICDQGGECDLQDQALIFGNDRGRFYEVKRSVSDKDCGPLVKTVMTRCIHCTRCVRFSAELSGVQELGTTGRGSKTEIGSYVAKSLTSEVSGNIIDLCPVGALTSKPYAFTARSWELKRTETIDTTDSMGSNISIQTAERKIARILPLLHEGINEEWIDDKTRFSYDGYYNQRLLSPLTKSGDRLIKKSWTNTISDLSFFFKPIFSNTSFIVGNSEPLETLSAIKQLSLRSDKFSFKFQDSIVPLNIDFRANYLFNSTVAALSDCDSCVLIGVDLKKEMPLLLMRIRRAQAKGTLKVGYFGNPANCGIKAINLGNTLDDIFRFIEGKNQFCSTLYKASNPLIIVGSSITSNINFGSVQHALLRSVFAKKKGKNCLNFLHTGSGKVGAYELGIQPTNVQSNSLVTLGTDGILCQDSNRIHLGTHGFDDIKSSKIVLPVKATIEADSLFINTEGRLQLSKKVSTPNSQIRDGYKLINLLEHLSFQNSKVLSSLDIVHDSIDSVSGLNYNSIGYISFTVSTLNSKKHFDTKGLVGNSVESFYKTTIVSKNSKNMASCVSSIEKLKVRSYKVT